MNQHSLKGQVMHSFAWVVALKYFGQFITWGSTIVVIRILSSEDYGLMAMATVFINFLTLISELGLSAAIVQKRDVKTRQLAQVFGLVVISNIFLFIILFLGAPVVAAYFSEQRLIPIIRVLSLNFFLLPLYRIPQSILIKNMDFRHKSIVDFLASLLSSGITLILAIYGNGVWALVWGIISFHAVCVLGYNFVCPIFLLPSFRLRGVNDLFSFGGFIMGSRILWYFYSKADIFIGARFLGNHLLGIYSVAFHLASVPMEKLMPIVNQIAFPAYSSIQSNLSDIRLYFLKGIRILSLLLFPVFGGILITAPDLVTLILGTKWLEVILPIQILCLIIPFRALASMFAPMLQGLGRADVTFVNSSIASVLMPLSFIIGVKWGGISGICFAWVYGYLVVFVIITRRSFKILDLPLNALLQSIRTPFSATLIMVLSIYIFKYSMGGFFPLLGTILFSLAIGTIAYFSTIFFASRKLLAEVWYLIPRKQIFNL